MAIASSWTVAGLPECRPDVEPTHVLTALRKTVLAAVSLAMGATAGFAYGSGRVAVAFQQSGNATLTPPLDELLVVTAGTATIAVNGGETIKLKKGEVASLMADHEVTSR
jgi:quercetin dioxygenase-like cupin family protein